MNNLSLILRILVFNPIFFIILCIYYAQITNINTKLIVVILICIINIIVGFVFYFVILKLAKAYQNTTITKWASWGFKIQIFSSFLFTISDIFLLAWQGTTELHQLSSNIVKISFIFIYLFGYFICFICMFFSYKLYSVLSEMTGIKKFKKGSKQMFKSSGILMLLLSITDIVSFFVTDEAQFEQMMDNSSFFSFSSIFGLLVGFIFSIVFIVGYINICIASFKITNIQINEAQKI